MTLAALGLVVLYPGTVQDVLDLGLHGVALSRASGLWTAVKIVTSVADGSGTALVDPDRIRPIVPTLEIDGRPWTPTLTSNVMTPSLEAELLGPRTEMALRYIVENDLNRIIVDAPRPWLGIVAGGHACEQVMEALATLGLDETGLAEVGVRVLKLGALSPFDGQSVRRLAAGTSTVLVVEDKSPNVETLVRDALYGAADQPRVLGKRDAEGQPLVPLTGALTAEGLVEPLRRVLTTVLPPDRLAPARTAAKLAFTLSPQAVRTPFFCSGCPHNTGTLVPEGSLVGAGIGCHGMVSFMGGGSRGTITGITQMGGEGSQWIGIAPFVADPHLFQNVGDGTFFHSGQLSVQAADRGRRRHHVQAALQRGRGHDRRPGRHRPAARARGRRQAPRRGRQGGRHHDRRPRQVPRGPAAQGRVRPSPRRHHRGPGAPADGPRRDDADPRPAVRGREAPRPQAGPAAAAGVQAHDRRAGLRGLRRLRRQVELLEPATDRHRVRPQDHHRPGQLQPRRQLPRRATARPSSP